MKTYNYLVMLVLVLGVIGCSSEVVRDAPFRHDDNIKSSTPFVADVYFCSHINDDAGIFTMNKNDLGNYSEIINLDGKFADSCVVDNEGNIYWGDRESKAIFKANNKGENIQEFVSGLDIPRGLAIDEKNERLYWANWLGDSDPQSGEIGYISLDGGEKRILINEGLKSGGPIIIDSENEKLYVSDLFGEKILEVSLITAEYSAIVTDAKQPSGLALNAEKNRLIWADIALDKISSINLDDFSQKDIIVFDDQFANPDAIAFDENENKLLFVSLVENRGMGSSKINQFQKIDLDGNNHEIISGPYESLYNMGTIVIVE